MVGVRSEVAARWDPVVEALFGDAANGSKVGVSEGQLAPGGMLVSGLAIDLEKRLRWKMAGTMLGGAVMDMDGEVDGAADEVLDASDAVKGEDQRQARLKVQMVVHVAQSLGEFARLNELSNNSV